MKLYAVKFDGMYEGGLCVVRAGSMHEAVTLAKAEPHTGDIESVTELMSEGPARVITSVSWG